MAQEIIGIGTNPNDGTGDTLREAMEKTNNNNTQQFGLNGWGMYVDGLLTLPSQVITTTPQLVSIDGAGATSDSNYLPRQIRGITEMWDVVNNKILAINIGDSYSMRLDLLITVDTTANQLNFGLDIGGGASPTIVIVQRLIGLGKTTPYSLSIGFPYFTLSTFKTNGGQLFVSTDTGTVTITSRSLMMARISNGLI